MTATHALMAEKAILGCMLLSSDLAQQGVTQLRESWFASGTNARVFLTMAQLVRQGMPVDTVTTTEACPSIRDYLLDLTDTIPSAENFRHYASILRERARLRELREASLGVAALAEAGDFAAAHRRLTDVAASTDDNTGIRVLSFGELTQAGLESACMPAEGRVHLGLERLSNAIGHPPTGALIVLAAGTGVGKSSMLLEMAMGCATSEQPVGMGIISMEDGAALTGARALAAMSGVSAKRLQRGSVEGDDWQRLSRACVDAQRIGDLVQFADLTGGTEADVIGCMALMAKRGAKIVAIDYIGKVKPAVRRMDRRVELGDTLTAIEAAAKRLRIVPIVVSQIARPDNRNPNAKPTKHSPKECGELENSARVLLLMWREEEDDFAPIHIEVAKCTWGGTGQRWTMQRSREDTGGGYGSARLREHAYVPSIPSRPFAQRYPKVAAAPGARVVSLADYRRPEAADDDSSVDQVSQHDGRPTQQGADTDQVPGE